MQRIITKAVIPFFLLITPFLLPVYHFTFDISTLLTVVSLIFAILIGFFIATATTNYLRLQSLIADEDSALIGIFNLAKAIQSTSVAKMREVIDQYVIAALDFELVDYVGKTEKQFSSVLFAIDELSPRNAKGMELIGNIYDKRSEVVRARQEIAFVARRIVTRLHWVVLFFLAALLIFLLFALRDGNLLFSAVTGILAVATYLILLLLYEVDGNIFLEEQLAYENSQQIFEAIGTLRYYPDYALQNKHILAPAGDYRVGIFKDYPRSLEKEIKTILQSS